MTTSPLSIGLLGCGSVGTLMAWHWRSCNLSVLPRDGHSDINLRLQTRSGDVQAVHLPCWQGEPLDWLVVTTKAGDTLNALKAWRAKLPAVKRLLLLQNGMGQQDETAQWLEQQALPCELWAGISTEGAYRTQDAQGPLVIYAGEGSNVAGRWPTRQTRAAQAGCPLPPGIRFVDDIRTPVREKLAVNAVINPLTGLLRCTNGELANNPDYRRQLLALAAEIAGLYSHLGWTLSIPLPERALAVARATAANRSSTLQDILAGRSTELSCITGYLLHCADRINYPLPLSRALYQQLQTV